MQCLLQTPGIREPLRGTVRTRKTSDDLEDESATAGDSIHVETSMTLNTDSMIESSVSSSVSDLQHTSSGQIDTMTDAVDQLQRRLIGHSGMHTIRPVTSIVTVHQPSNNSLPAVQSSIPPTSSVDMALSGMVTATTSSLVDLTGFVRDGQVQPATTLQYSRPAVTMLVNCRGRCVVLPVAQLASTPASQASTVTASATKQQLSVTRHETLALMNGGDEVTQYLTRDVVPDCVEYNSCQSVNQQQQKQHR